MHINSNRAITKFFVATLMSMPIRLNLGIGNDIVIKKEVHTLLAKISIAI